MSAYGISGFVDGFIKGRGLRMDAEDRKDAKERQKRLDDLLFAQDARAAEEHARRMGVFDRNAAADQRTLDDENARREALKRAYEAAEESYQAGTTTSSPDQPQPAASQGAGLPLVIPTNRTAEAFTGPGGLPAASQGVGLPLVIPTNRTAEAFTGPGGLGASKPMQIAPAQVGPTKAAADAQQATHAGLGAVRAADDAAVKLKRTASGYTIAPAPSAAIADELYRQGPAGVRYIPTAENERKKAEADDAAVKLKRTASGYTIAPAPSAAIADELYRQGPAGVRYIPTAENERKKAEADDAAAERLRKAAYDDNLLPTSQKVQAAADLKELGYVAVDGGKRVVKASDVTASTPAGAESKASVVSGRAGPTNANAGLRQTATTAMAEAASPAVAAAAQSAQVQSPKAMGLRPGEKVTAKQRDRAATTFIDHYMKVGAPMVIEDMIRRGDFDGATNFQAWMDTQGARAGMKSWANAAFSASIGDMDGFASAVVEAYNRMDYVSDGTSIVEDKSGFTYGKNGEITGAKLTFRDEASGNTFEQVFADPDDLVRMGITLLAPEKAYEAYAAQVAAMGSRGLSAKDRADAETEMAKRIDDIAKTIFESGQSAALIGGEPISYEQARAMAEQAILGGGLGSLGQSTEPPPVLRRP